MDNGQIELVEQIARCRRLARSLTDEQMRHALEELAKNYESELEHRGAGFMLQRRTG